MEGDRQIKGTVEGGAASWFLSQRGARLDGEEEDGCWGGMMGR